MITTAVGLQLRRNYSERQKLQGARPGEEGDSPQVNTRESPLLRRPRRGEGQTKGGAPSSRHGIARRRGKAGINQGRVKLLGSLSLGLVVLFNCLGEGG